MSAPRPSVIGHHLIWTLYGHWLANDPRGSGSEAVRDPKFVALGEAHLGRKSQREQPSREELREFYRSATPLLEFRPFWMDEAKRHAVGETIGGVAAERGYTVWACAVLANHVHMVIRRHRDDALAMWRAVAEATRDALRAGADVDADHPVWAARPYKVFLKTPEDVRRCIAYVGENPAKEGLARQRFAFVAAYDNWPFHKGRPR